MLSTRSPGNEPAAYLHYAWDMEADTDRLLNEKISSLLDAQTLDTVHLALAGPTVQKLAELAEEGGWDPETSARIALLYGLSSALAERAPAGDPAEEANALGSQYVALKYQLFKLRTETFRLEARVNAVVSQNRTFRDLIERLGRD